MQKKGTARAHHYPQKKGTARAHHNRGRRVRLGPPAVQKKGTVRAHLNGAGGYCKKFQRPRLGQIFFQNHPLGVREQRMRVGVSWGVAW